MSSIGVLACPSSEGEQLGSIRREQGSHVTVDFFMLLPLELVYLIVSFLSLPNVLTCLAVCKPWNKTLTQMHHYWRKACQKLGLSRATFERHVSRHGSGKKLLYRILEHRHSIWSHSPVVSRRGEGFPHDMHYVCHHVKEGLMAGVVYKNFCPYRIQVDKLVGDQILPVATIQPTYPMYTENRIYWAHIFQGSHLICATASGLWSVYNLSMPGKMRHPLVTLQWKAEPMYDLEARVDCCDLCGMVGTAKLILNHIHGAHWEVRVIEMPRESLLKNRSQKRLPLPSVTKFYLKTEIKDLTSTRNTYARKRFVLLPASDTVQQPGFCSTHHLLVQWSHTIETHKLVYQGRDGGGSSMSQWPDHRLSLVVASLPDRRYEIHIDKEDVDEALMRNRGLNTDFAVSEDKQMLGCVFQSELVTWELGVPATTSKSRVTLEAYSHEDIKLIALGHIYSLIGLEFQQSLLVVATRTGEIVLKCSNFAIRHSNMLAPYMVFCSCSGRGWLSDLSQPCSCIILYWNKTSRSMEAIALGHQTKELLSSEMVSPPHNAVHHRRWWQRS